MYYVNNEFYNNTYVCYERECRTKFCRYCARVVRATTEGLNRTVKVYTHRYVPQ